MRSMVNATTIGGCLPRVQVKDSGGVWKNLSTRLFSVSYNDSLDADSSSATLMFRNHPDWVTGAVNENLDPWDQGSTYNLVAGSYSPLLARQNEIKLEVSKDAGANYYEVFRGRVGPGTVEVTTDVSKDDTVTVTPVDMSFPFKEFHFYTPLIYKDADAVSIMSQIFADHGFNETVAEIDAPGFHVEHISTGETNVWAAQKALIEPTGFIYRIKWHGGEFQPCVYDPDRTNTSPDATLTGTFSYRRIDTSEADVRTKIVIIYRHRDTGEIDYAQAENETAKDKYGIPDGSGGRLHKTMWYAVQGTGERYSMIDTAGEAKTLADLVLHDLEAPVPNIEVRLPYIHPGIEIHDLLSIVGDDYTVLLGVTGLTWNWTANNNIGETIIQGVTDRIVGEFGLWLARDAHSPEVQRDLHLAFMQGDGLRPPRPATPAGRSYWGTDSATGEDVAVITLSTTPVNVWDLLQYRWRYQIEGEDAPREETTKTHYLILKGLPVGTKLRGQVRTEDWSSLGG